LVSGSDEQAADSAAPVFALTASAGEEDVAAIAEAAVLLLLLLLFSRIRPI
jgi:hypothetical protein